MKIADPMTDRHQRNHALLARLGRILEYLEIALDPAEDAGERLSGCRAQRASTVCDRRQGPLDVTANAGFHHVVNSDHIEGRTVNRFEGRLQATLGIGRRGVLQ